jgi:tetratricopeptide (TPR) repeat protein
MRGLRPNVKMLVRAGREMPVSASTEYVWEVRMSRLALCLTIALLLGIAPPAHAADTASPFAAPDLSGARAKIKAKDYAGCLALLRPMLNSTINPDLFNLAGFCFRKTGDQKQAWVYYDKALALDPNHLGTLEYQGELFVETGQLDKARRNAAQLKILCPKGCEELEDLQAAIAKAPKT